MGIEGLAFEEVMHLYFRGEKIEAFAFILPLGALLVSASALALRYERTSYAVGLAVPALLGGLLLMVVGATVGWRTSAQVEALEAAHDESPATMAAAELPRMEKVNATFHLTMVYVFPILVALGLLLGVAGRIDWLRGVGTGLLLIGALGLVIDGVASRRAETYTAALQALARPPG